MTKKYLLFTFVFLSITFVAATAFRRKEGPPATARPRPLTTSGMTAPAGAQTQGSAQSPRNVAADERKMTTLEVAKLSRRVVLARCRSVDVREIAGSNIFTFYEFEVLQELRGGTGENSFTLRILGGRVGNSEVSSVLDYVFVPEQRYVLFLGRENAEGYPTIASQSIFQVRVNPLDKSAVVTPTPTGLKLYSAKDGRRYSDQPDLLPLEDFLLSIKKLDR
jgi:hypothetical protein